MALGQRSVALGRSGSVSMWNYEKKLQYPVKISNPNPAYAKIILTQLGGPDGEMGATTRYLNQRYTMPYATGKAILTDIATEEVDHCCCISSKQKKADTW